MPDRKHADTEILPALNDPERPYSPRQYAIYLAYHMKDVPITGAPDQTYAIYIQGPMRDKPLMALRHDGELILNDGWEQHSLARLFMESIRAMQARHVPA